MDLGQPPWSSPPWSKACVKHFIRELHAKTLDDMGQVKKEKVKTALKGALSKVVMKKFGKTAAAVIKAMKKKVLEGLNKCCHNNNKLRLVVVIATLRRLRRVSTRRTR